MTSPGADASSVITADTAVRPRILFLDHVGELGGAELCLLDLVAHTKDPTKVILMDDGPLHHALQSAGVNVEVLPLSQSISCVRRSSGLLHAVRCIPQIFKLARKIARSAKRFDVIWANSQKSFVIGCFSAFLARRPLVWHMHDILTADHFSPSNRWVAVKLANLFASKVVTVSNAGRQSFIDSGGRSSLACVIYNGIDPSAFECKTGDASSQNQINLRTEFNVGVAPLIGVFGRLTPWKGQDVLIRALKLLPGIHAVLVGDALFEQDEYKAQLKRLAIDTGVADRVHFAGFRSDIAGAMSGVDIVAHTSTSPEPFGRVLVEAMLAKKPLVASNAGGAAEIVTHGSDGLLIQPNQPEILAEAIHQILHAKIDSQRMVEQGYKMAVQRFSLQAYIAAAHAVAIEVSRRGRSPDQHVSAPTGVSSSGVSVTGLLSSAQSRPVEALGS